MKKARLTAAIISACILASASQVGAQTFTTLYSFTALIPYYTNSDGANPYGGLILSGNTLYGTASQGGSSDNGTVFAIHTDGTRFTNLYSFTAFSNSTNSDGANPKAGLILSGNTLYGTTTAGGSSSVGTVFAVNTDGTDFTNLHNFIYNSDGGDPQAGLVLSGNTLYGTASQGGSSDNGTVFAVHTDGTGFTTLHSFPFGGSDGVRPVAGLILSGNTLYGTASGGGSSYGNGTVFAVNINDMSFTNLHSFSATSISSPFTNSDGASPQADLILSGNTLYGTTVNGGSSGNGTVFAVNTDGTGFTNLYSFTGDSGGANPQARLILSGNTLYGTARIGGSGGGNGIVFAVNTDGTGFTILHNFTGGTDGTLPYAGLILFSNALYGTASGGGSSGNGTVFSLGPVSNLSSPPSLSIASSGNQAVLFWSASATGYILQSTTNLTSPNWTTASDAVPVTAFTVTNTSPTRFFRLQQQP
jgi:uncharacterized repeat protein (TIGR03803 family)